MGTMPYRAELKSRLEQIDRLLALGQPQERVDRLHAERSMILGTLATIEAMYLTRY